LQPVRDNNTRWFSVYFMLLYTIKIKNSLDLFVSCYLTPRIKGEKDLSNHMIKADNWAYCTVLLFISLLNIIMKEIKRKATNSKFLRIP
jgi:hypothetical protein